MAYIGHRGSGPAELLPTFTLGGTRIDTITPPGQKVDGPTTGDWATGALCTACSCKKCMALYDQLVPA